MAFKALSLLSTVVVLFSMALFLFASLPLLVLKHDTPMDARFVRGLFNLYYTALTSGGVAGTIGYGLVGNYMFSAGMAVIVLVTLFVRRWMLRSMDTLRAEMAPGDKPRIRQFKRLHMSGMAINVAQLACTVISLRGLAI